MQDQCRTSRGRLTHNQPSRRTVAGRFALLALALVCLASPQFSSPALAQHAPAGVRPMATGTPGGMMGTPGMHVAPPPGVNRPGGFDRPPLDSHGQPRMGLQLGLSGRWWDDHGTVRKLNLDPDQRHRMDTIFEANKPALINRYINLQREEMNLASLSPADLQDETKVFAAIDRASQARSDLEKEKAHILLQLRQQLDTQQLDTLDHQIANSH
jgi:Spy/CpxP family protein refolding chaperone